MNEQQRLVAEHQQGVGNRLAGSRQQRLEFDFAQVFEELCAVLLQIGK
ncbi:hypothetical protein PS847_01903 [Pseudomonas fluorescens]|uniref:Uncharacterized protein n=1 Tax=Pseudomonas fluorescens TaxID=294 RepID=A0A5E7J0E7_PSEFL|nr:hypothetical protein PS847_01903 [Pseudomonas fluorescens]